MMARFSRLEIYTQLLDIGVLPLFNHEDHAVAGFGADTLPGWHAQPAEMFSEDYQAEMLAAYTKMLSEKPFVVGQHVWNICDLKTGQGVHRSASMNRNGVCTRDRRPPLDAHRLRELLGRRQVTRRDGDQELLMEAQALFAAPHRRLNLLTGEWVLVSPHRTQRPWQGQVEDRATEQRPAYDPGCYLCPGNARAGGAQTPRYETTYVFENDFAALRPDTATHEHAASGDASAPLLRAESERGICRVVCFSPRHDLTLADMELADIRRVVDLWADQYAELGAIPWVRHVQIFENRGAMMGASNPHPHGQIWANERLPNEPAKELRQQERYAAERGGCLLCDYLETELRAGIRVVVANEQWVALVPFWAVWPFETLVLPRAHHGALPDLDSAGRDGLADVLRRLNRRYNRLFDVSFPYSMGLHQRPTDGAEYPAWHLHAHFYPPLLRSATVRKFMVGYELLGQPQRDITPEHAAERLRNLSED